MQELQRIEESVRSIEESLTRPDDKSWFRTQSARVLTELREMPIAWALALPSLFSVGVAKALSVLSGDYSGNTLSVLFSWFIAVYIAVPLLGASLVSYGVSWKEGFAFVGVATIGILLAALAGAAGETWSVFLSTVVVAGITGLILWRRRVAGADKTNTGWRRIAEARDYIHELDRKKLDRLESLHGWLRLGPALIGLAMLVVVFARVMEPYPASFAATFASMHVLGDLDGASHAIAADRTEASVRLAAATAVNGGIPCEVSTRIPEMLRRNHRLLQPMYRSGDDRLAWLAARYSADWWNSSRALDATLPTTPRCAANPLAVAYLEQLSVLDHQVGGLHASLYKKQQNSIADIYRRQRDIAVSAYALAALFLVAAITSTVVAVGRLTRRDEDPTQRTVADALLKVREYYLYSLGVAVLFALPLIAPIEASKVDPERAGGLFTFKSWYLLSITETPLPVEYKTDEPTIQPDGASVVGRQQLQRDNALVLVQQQLSDVRTKIDAMRSSDSTNSADVKAILARVR